MRQSNTDVIALILVCVISAICTITLFIGAISLFNKAYAATVWTQQPNEYSWYKQGTANRYVLITDVEVPISWIKQPGIYIQCKSDGGATKYWPKGYDCTGKQVNVPTCTGFKCIDSFGITYDLTKNTVLACPMVKIANGVAMEYDGAQSIAGVPTCR